MELIYKTGSMDNMNIFIFKNIGVKGFYSNNLFKYNEEFTPYLKNSIELGRSFVQPKYWGTRALDYLWFGIGAYIKNNPNIKTGICGEHGGDISGINFAIKNNLN